MELSENAQIVLKKRYLLKDSSGKPVEAPEEMFRRVAKTIAEAERDYNNESEIWAEKYFKIMSSLKFLPNSPILMNAGKSIGQLAACFVLPVEDSMDSIFGSLKNAALILQSGGGTGFSFSHLRPREDIVQSTGGIASGPVSFMKVYNTATEVIKQGGARRGANMGILRIDHPDIVDFIRIKRAQGELENFNISVAVTDTFMRALYNNKEYALLNPRTREIRGKISAKTVFDEIVRSAWETGDPGIIFIDSINRTNPTPNLGTIESTNPCGEQPLLPYEACVLGSIDISKYILTEDSGVMIDFETLSDDIMTAVRFLDDSIDVNKYPLHDIEIMHRGNRKIGLGIMGWADLLISLGMPYDSRNAFRLAEKFMKYFTDTARQSSIKLAEERGVFPNFRGSVYDRPGMPRVRNATSTTIAPTGTLSIIADCSSGIEPIYALTYKRRVIDTELIEINRHFFNTARSRGFYSDELREIIMRKGTLKGAHVPKKMKELFKTAHEIHYRDHIEMQASFQKYTDNAVSKTVNMPRSAKKEDVANAFLLAFEKNCKGITVFRQAAHKRGVLVPLADSETD
jgi:ribonucleoside-diphosphate reductase alpha chain